MELEADGGSTPAPTCCARLHRVSTSTATATINASFGLRSRTSCGRAGRSHHRAHPARSSRRITQRRLEAIEHRGTGRIAGHLTSWRWRTHRSGLAWTTGCADGETPPTPASTGINLRPPADCMQMASASPPPSLDELQTEVGDRFGALPERRRTCRRPASAPSVCRLDAGAQALTVAEVADPPGAELPDPATGISARSPNCARVARRLLAARRTGQHVATAITAVDDETALRGHAMPQHRPLL